MCRLLKVRVMVSKVQCPGTPGGVLLKIPMTSMAMGQTKTNPTSNIENALREPGAHQAASTTI